MTTVLQPHLTLALLLSLLFHLTVLVGPGWVLPTDDEARETELSPPIEAHLSPPPVRRAAVPAAPALPAPAKRRNESEIAKRSKPDA